jgi:hypothetical protein
MERKFTGFPFDSEAGEQFSRARAWDSWNSIKKIRTRRGEVIFGAQFKFLANEALVSRPTGSDQFAGT